MTKPTTDPWSLPRPWAWVKALGPQNRAAASPPHGFDRQGGCSLSPSGRLLDRGEERAAMLLLAGRQSPRRVSRLTRRQKAGESSPPHAPPEPHGGGLRARRSLLGPGSLGRAVSGWPWADPGGQGAARGAWDPFLGLGRPSSSPREALCQAGHPAGPQGQQTSGDSRVGGHTGPWVGLGLSCVSIHFENVHVSPVLHRPPDSLRVTCGHTLS